MGRRSIQASVEGIKAIKRALKRKSGGQTYLAGSVGCSRQTIWSLLQGNSIDCDVFMAVCAELGLQWEDMAAPEAVEPEPTENSALDQLVQQARETIAPLIQERCGTMRVLDMSQPIGLGEIYTHVNILEKITGRSHRELAELLRSVTPEEVERFSLGTVREQRIPGLEAVEKHRKLMILGKPGAGKTTFLKHLAIQCSGGKFQAHRVPIFITLKDFAEADRRPELFTHLASLLPSLLPSPSLGRGAGGEGQPDRDLRSILDPGRALILLDGLDEVRETDASRVLQQIQQFAERYPGNAFVITCRIAAREYAFQQFTEVEVADFDAAQIADVSGKWFRAKQDEVKATRFLAQLKANPPIRDLASSPLLLTLLCLVFEDSGDFPANRAELYQSGVDVLLKKWDTKRNIERDQVYKKLSLKRKEDLLSQIAWRTFAAGNYFFKQKDVEQQIRAFIENLPGASTDEDTLNLDSEAVLKSIEAQHGLFVERARGIYSFSHLTFHEYFAAREAKEKAYFTLLTAHLTEKQWREVILLTVGMLPEAGKLLTAMKQAIDGLLAEDGTLQRVLVWAQQKAESANAPYKMVAIRAFYFYFILDNHRPLTLARDLAFDLDDLPLLRDLALSSVSLTLARTLDQNLDHNLDNVILLRSPLLEPLSLSFNPLSVANRNSYHHVRKNARNLSRAIKKLGSNDPELKLKLENLYSQMPISEERWELEEQGWLEQEQAWLNQLRVVMIEHRNIGHDWQLSEAQTQRLQQYYEANQLLVACLNSDCYVSRAVREEIEDTLLLPLAEIERRSTS